MNKPHHYRFENTSLVLLVIFIGWTIYTAYLAPHLLLSLRYNVPGWIWYARIWVVENFGASERNASLIILGFMVGIALCLFFVEKLLTKEATVPLDRAEMELKKKKLGRLRAEIKNTSSFFLQIILLALAIFMLLMGIHWLISIV